MVPGRDRREDGAREVVESVESQGHLGCEADLGRQSEQHQQKRQASPPRRLRSTHAALAASAMASAISPDPSSVGTDSDSPQTIVPLTGPSRSPSPVYLT